MSMIMSQQNIIYSVVLYIPLCLIFTSVNITGKLHTIWDEKEGNDPLCLTKYQLIKCGQQYWKKASVIKKEAIKELPYYGIIKMKLHTTWNVTESNGK